MQGDPVKVVTQALHRLRCQVPCCGEPVPASYHFEGHDYDKIVYVCGTHAQNLDDASMICAALQEAGYLT